MARTRQGFVSNSSSSSFIIGLGVAVDPEALSNIGYGINTRQLCDIFENPGWTLSVKTRGDRIYLEMESFTYNTVELDVTEVPPDSDIAIVYATGHDDSDFWNGDDYDYDSDNWELEGHQEEALKALEDDELIEFGTYEIGAGRNG